MVSPKSAKESLNGARVGVSISATVSECISRVQDKHSAAHTNALSLCRIAGLEDDQSVVVQRASILIS